MHVYHFVEINESFEKWRQLINLTKSLLFLLIIKIQKGCLHLVYRCILINKYDQNIWWDKLVPKKGA